MTQEEKRFKIAEFLGWKGPFGWGLTVSGRQGIVGIDPDGDWEIVPNYFNDLNAYHDVYHSLKLTDQIAVLQGLYEIVKARCANNLDEMSIWMVCVNAKLPERGESLGIGFRLWREGE